MRPTWQGILVLALLLLPWLSLLGGGAWWLWREGWLSAWLLAAAGSGLLGWLVLRRLRRESLRGKPEVRADPKWLARDREAWAEIEALAAQVRPADYPLDQSLPHRLLELGSRVIQTVAGRYRPDAANPVLEVPLPYLLKSLEWAVRDLRDLIGGIPFSHTLTLKHILRAPRWFKIGGQVYDTYRAASLLFNPLDAALRELKSYMAGQIARYPREELVAWFVANYAKQVGKYAIDLYSGALLLEDGAATAAPAPGDAAAPEGPLRILLLGQVNSGKSSLLNALFGEIKAWSDALPLSQESTPYLLERDGLPQAVVLDTAGYGARGGPAGLSKSLEAECLRCDLLILVCSAVNAAREADREVLRRLRALYDAHPRRAAPPVVCVLSQIDRLPPPREWRPPYNIAAPQRAKERAIRQALESVAAELELPPGDIVPARLSTGREYNIAEGVVPALLDKLPEARHACYIRCLRQAQSAEYWRQLRAQARKTGRIILEAGGAARAWLKK